MREAYRHARRLLFALFGRDLWQPTQVQIQRVCLGNEGARWCVYPGTLVESSVVYSLGVGHDASFDFELIQRFGVHIHAFDPTPSVSTWLHSRTLPPNFTFHPYGVADFDGTCRFYPPKKAGQISHTVVDRGSAGAAVDAPVHRLRTIMESLGHRELALLKMDIEGAEYRVLRDMLQCGLRVRQLLVEFHHRWPEIGLPRTKLAIQALNDAGYRIFSASSTGEEFSFIK
jgi:FkbM family methyltransferase